MAGPRTAGDHDSLFSNLASNSSDLSGNYAKKEKMRFTTSTIPAGILNSNKIKKKRVRCCHNGWYGATCTSSRQKRQKRLGGMETHTTSA